MIERQPGNIRRLSSVVAYLVIAGLLSACAPAIKDSADGHNEVQYIYGTVKEVFPQQDSLIVRSKKGSSLRLDLNAQSELIGIPSLEKDLVEGVDVKVWYVSEGGKHHILKLEKVPYLGC